MKHKTLNKPEVNMTTLTEIETLVLHLCEGGIAATALRREVVKAHPNLTDSKYLATLLTLQDKGRLFGEDITGVWVFTSVSEHDLQASNPEYSPEFAEMITAADCGEWHEINSDDLLAELEEMLQKAKARKGK